jgi:hypothetical protein
MYPVVDRRSVRSPPQSASHEPVSFIVSFLLGLPRVSESSAVPFTYRRIRFAAVQCVESKSFANYAILLSAVDMSGRVASIRYIRDPMICRYGISVVLLLLLRFSFTSRIEGSDGV